MTRSTPSGRLGRPPGGPTRRGTARRPDQAAGKKALAAGYHSLERSYRKRETVFAAVMADRADWVAATRSQRHLAIAADAELRRRHPGQYFAPLRSAEPEHEPATQAQRDKPTPPLTSRPARSISGSRT